MIHRLNGSSFSTGAHAYDLHEGGGDWLLDLKLREAAWIHTSTDHARQVIVTRGGDPRRVALIRRGLEPFPSHPVDRMAQPPYRLISVGRLVEKMGHDRLVRICARLKAAGFPFTAELIGSGPLAASLRRQVQAAGLEGHLRLTGALPYPEVEARLRQSDVLVFAGRIDRSGDRAGLPNVIGEAMAHGIPVVASLVGGVGEAIVEGMTGRTFSDEAEAAAAVVDLCTNPEQAMRLRRAARAWAETHFQARANAQRLWRWMVPTD